MADTIRSTDYFLNASTGVWKNANNITAQMGRDLIKSAYQPQARSPGGRLTLTTGVPVTTADVTAATNIYYTPYINDCISLYDGTSWTLFTFTELTLALGTLTAALPYDVFIYDNSGTLTLEALAWTNGTTRATALALTNGVYLKTGALTRRYLGTFYTTATTTTEDSVSKRFLYNRDNKAVRPFLITDTTDTWSYNTATIRQARASTANKIEFVLGEADAIVNAMMMVTVNVVNGYAQAGLGLDSTTAMSGIRGACNLSSGNIDLALLGFYNAAPGVGYHYLSWNEHGNGAGTITWTGDAGTAAGADRQSGITGFLLG